MTARRALSGWLLVGLPLLLLAGLYPGYAAYAAATGRFLPRRPGRGPSGPAPRPYQA